MDSMLALDGYARAAEVFARRARMSEAELADEAAAHRAEVTARHEAAWAEARRTPPGELGNPVNGEITYRGYTVYTNRTVGLGSYETRNPVGGRGPNVTGGADAKTKIDAELS